ncbi:terminase large subunit [Paenibacillus lutimineralis]|uniref:Terminase large subunit n=1 Tax=Paenibacillus lutimineralis TaxID=2707005 RepID=A0A3S9V4C8_9BACL|nr:terminase TerL endonuclease subunit [Paenibacillus lutimineralis]AZS17400.1 terminase large subunit [Paenibacillus lutimineralis]
MPDSSNKIDWGDVHPTNRYAAEIVMGLRPSCEMERLACQRHLDDLQRQATEDFPYVFDESRADRIFEWFERCCRHVRGPFSGQLIELLPFQKFDLGAVFGWVHMETGKRRFIRAFHMRARGNVKSTEMSGIALYGMLGDCIYPPGNPDLKRYEDSPEVECAAVDRTQAKRVWSDAKKMGENSPDISKRLVIKKTYIEHRTRGGFLRPLSKDTKNKDSGAPCIVIIDEYHAHPTSEIVDVSFSGFGKRLQSLMQIISTAGKDAENNPCKREYDDLCKMMRGEIKMQETSFVMIREIDKDDDPHDESIWIKANPVLQEDNEYSRTLLAQIRAEHDDAFDKNNPSKIREFLTKRVNRWQSDSENKYMSGIMDKWKELAIPRNDFLELVKGQKNWTGLDLSKTTDLTADGFVFRLDDGRFAVTAHGFIPAESAMRHEHTDRVPYKQWAKEGWCTLTEGAVTDYRYIRSHLHEMEDFEKWILQEICYDGWNATHFAQELENEGRIMIEIPQYMKNLSAPTKFFRELVLQGQLVHDGSPLLDWCLSNAVEITDSSGNIKLSKKHKDDSQRIDLIAALINAMARAMLNEDKSSVYETRDVRAI